MASNEHVTVQWVLDEVTRVLVHRPSRDWRYSVRDIVERFGRTLWRDGYSSALQDDSAARREERDRREQATESAGPGSAYVVPDDPKMLQETLAVAQAAVGQLQSDPGRREQHMARLQRLIDECERKRPVGPDGKHGDRHTAECGCDDG